jgi:hypothetical protein
MKKGHVIVYAAQHMAGACAVLIYFFYFFMDMLFYLLQ